MKKLVSAAIFLAALLFACALCEEVLYIKDGEVGVVKRETAVYRTRALIEELDVAYLEADTPYLTKNVQTRFTVHATGGDGKYTYTFTVFRRDGTSGLFYQKASSGTTRSNNYYYTPNTESGQYILSIRITDSAGSYIQWQSQVFESAEHACALKAESLAEECMKKAGTDYARALWLHDWLIYNADYDYTYQNYYPDGVLLKGKGVCQSYALAYEMLLKLVGIDSVYVTGQANGASHAWNLVNIDGKWFHVDCTWDDPAPGKENRNYFCVPDHVMIKDHTWRQEVQILPESTESTYMYALRSGADTCTTQADVLRILDEALSDGRGYVEIWYTGEKETFDFRSAFDAWYDEADFPSGFQNCRYTVSGLSMTVQYNYGNGFPDLSKPESMVIDLNDNDLEAGEGMHLLLLTLPSSAEISTVRWTSSDSACITVDENGFVRAVKPGVSRITATHPNGKQAKIDLYVSSHMHLTLPDTITVIEEGAFSDCYLLETVVVPYGVTEIGDGAFSGCSLLKSIAIPETVRFIGENAFSSCGRVVIECPMGSYAHEYAKAVHLPSRVMSTEP